MALEPNPLLCRYLLWNVRLNAAANVWPLCAGAGAESGLRNSWIFLRPRARWLGQALDGSVCLIVLASTLLVARVLRIVEAAFAVT